MKQIQFNKRTAALLVLAAAVATGSSCSLKKADNALSTSQIAFNATDPNNDIPGQGSTSIPTQEAAIARLLNVGLAGSGVTRASTNTATVITQVSGNLPQLTNPVKANGWDQVPFLALAACADISNANAQSVYGVNIGGTLASQRNALIAAGTKFTDAYLGGLASQAPYAAQVSQIFTTLVDQNQAISPAITTRQAFNSVCMAANVFGVLGKGF